MNEEHGRKPRPKLKFEAALARLETIVAELEGEAGGLEEGLRNYETGIGLVRGMHDFLERAQRKIERLTERGARGYALQPFREEDADDESASPPDGEEDDIPPSAAAEPPPRGADRIRPATDEGAGESPLRRTVPRGGKRPRPPGPAREVDDEPRLF